jgi:ABC-type sugar transport system ATPase subunit
VNNIEPKPFETDLGFEENNLQFNGVHLEAQKITKFYGGVQALNQVDFEIKPGEIVGLIGDNGAGKSTLLKILSGALQPSGGRILLDEEEVNISSPSVGRSLGIETVYQHLALINQLGVAENLFLKREIIDANLLGKLTRKLNKKEMLVRSRETLEQLQIHLRDYSRPVGFLSGGERQAIAIGRAVMWGTRLLLLDEPMASLGVHEIRKVLNLIKELGSRGVSITLITHNVRHIFEVVDRIVLLRLGEKVLDCPKEDTSIAEVTEKMTIL